MSVFVMFFCGTRSHIIATIYCTEEKQTNPCMITPILSYLKALPWNFYAFVADERLSGVSITDLVINVVKQYPDATKFSPSVPGAGEVTSTPQRDKINSYRLYLNFDAINKTWEYCL